MSRISCVTVATLAIFAACSPKASDGGTDPNASAVDAAPKVPRVMGFEMGTAVDAMGYISGGIRSSFMPTDTIDVSVSIENVGLGGKISVRLLADTTQLAIAEAAAPAPDSLGRAIVALKLASAKPMKVGTYHLQVMLESQPQVSKDVEITKDGQPTPPPAAKGGGE